MYSLPKNVYRERIDFSKIKTTVPIPNLIEIQKKSYERFLQMNRLPSEREDVGLQSVFKSVFPISDFRENSSLEFIEYSIGNWECKCGRLMGLEHLRKKCDGCGATLVADPYGEGAVICPSCGRANEARGDVCDLCGTTVSMKLKYDVEECQERGMTFAVPLKVTIRLVVWNKDPETGVKTIRDIKEQEVYFGDIPLMGDHGTFIINGTERVIVSQLHRSPGAFFHTEDKALYVAQIIPYRGSWVEFEYDAKNLLYVRIDRKRKFLATVFLRALGLRGADEILRAFYTSEDLVLRGGKILWKVTDGLVGRRSAAEFPIPGSELALHVGKKIRKDQVDALKKSGVDAVELVDTEREGAFACTDVIDPSTGEVMLEANEELSERVIAMAQEKNVESIGIFFPEKDEIGSVLSATLKKDPIQKHEEALIEIYRRLRPGDPPTLDSSRNLFENMFFNAQKYDFSRVGRLKLNTKLKLTTPLDEKVLHPADFYEVIRYLLKLKKNPANIDDIDHLGNRRVRSVGELLENQFRIGLVRMERAIKEKMSVYQEMATAMPHDLINAKPVMAAIREFFGSSQLSQFMDQTNPLSEVTHKRRLSALGPGGLSRERAGFEVRDVHPTHYGRICPIETPEGPNIGLISSLSSYARINDFGFIESPYRKVKDGRVMDYVIVTNAGGHPKYKVGDIVEADDLVGASGQSKKKGVEFEPYLLLPVGVGRGPVHHRAGQRRARRRRLHQGRARQRAPGGRLHPVAAREGRLHRRLAEAARVGRGLAHPVPRERRREPRADGIEHAAPGRAAAPGAGAVHRHRHGVHHGARFGRRRRGAPVGHGRLRRQQAHRRARRGQRERRPVARDGRRHLQPDQVQALEPEHVHQSGSDCACGAARDQGPGPGRRPVHGARRARARPQRARRLHAVARVQLRGRDPRLRASREGRLLHVDPHRGVRDRGARHEARARGNHARHPERLGDLPPRPRRERHHPDWRLRQAGRHPRGQGHAEGRDAAHAGREAAARDLRREGRRREGRVAHLPAGHRGHRRGRADLLAQGHREGRPRQADRAGRARPDGEEPAGRDPHPARGDEEAPGPAAQRPDAAHGPLRRRRARARAPQGRDAHGRGDGRRAVRGARPRAHRDGRPRVRGRAAPDGRSHGAAHRRHPARVRGQEGEDPPRRRAAAGRDQARQDLRRDEAQAVGRRQDGRPPRQQGRHRAHPPRGGHAVSAGRHSGRDRAQPARRAVAYERRPDSRDASRLGRARARPLLRDAGLRRRDRGRNQEVARGGRTAARRKDEARRRHDGRAVRAGRDGGLHLHAQAVAPGRRQDPRTLDRAVLAHHAAAARRQGAVRRTALRRNGGLGARGLWRGAHPPGAAHGQIRRRDGTGEDLRGDRQGRRVVPAGTA